jgi:pyrrolysyl-tRNA synthetase-like protein
VLEYLSNRRPPLIKCVETNIVNALLLEGFSEVITPTIISKGFILRMGIDESKPIWKQIFWIDEGRCLRPMLAPNLYNLLETMKFSRPLRIFEVGTCFRKESKGKMHLEEFTMLNAVELAPLKEPLDRLKELTELIMCALKLDDFVLKKVESDVYGHTIDVIVNGVEIASSAVGPIDIDRNWGITEPWSGIGIGLERLCSVIMQSSSVKPFARSLSYVNGKCIRI